MRITNQMQSNRLLQNINRSQTLVDTLYNQLTSGKKILLPSDDPIVATRALKFRTNITRTEQFLTNVSQGMAWMDITEEGYSNTDEILADIRDQLVEGGTDSFTYEDRQKMASAIEELQRQIGHEMNIDFAGRFVFSGLRTDQPPVIIHPEDDATFRIHQRLSIDDLEFSRLYTKADGTAIPELQEVYRLKLPYNDAQFLRFTNQAELDELHPDGTPAEATGWTITEIHKDGTEDPDTIHAPGANEIIFIPETGELLLREEDVAQFKEDFKDDGFNITYRKVGLQEGDLNPRVYFNCEEIGAQPDPKLEATQPDRIFRTENQDLAFEFGISTRYVINSKANETYTPQLYADLKALTELLNSCELSSESELKAKFVAEGMTDEEADQAVKDQLTEEAQTYRSVMQRAFSNALGTVETHIVQLNKEYAKIGTRMTSVEMIGNRLTDDRTSYRQLMNENEGVDYMEVMMYLTTAEYVYNAALKVGGNIQQISLMDYIR